MPFQRIKRHKSQSRGAKGFQRLSRSEMPSWRPRKSRIRTKKRLLSAVRPRKIRQNTMRQKAIINRAHSKPILSTQKRPKSPSQRRRPNNLCRKNRRGPPKKWTSWMNNARFCMKTRWSFWKYSISQILREQWLPDSLVIILTSDYSMAVRTVKSNRNYCKVYLNYK